MKYDQNRARQAVKYLVETPYFPHRVRGLRTEVKRPRALPYTDEAEVLNELLVIGRQNLQAMENLIAVAAYKRDDDRNEYQRLYMAAQRKRFRMAVELEERRTGHKMGLDERTRFAHEVQALWLEERDAYVESRTVQVKQQFGEYPTHEDKKAFIEVFWQNKAAELQAMLAETPRPDHNLRKRRRVVQVTAPSAPNTAMAQAFLKQKNR